MYEPGPCSGGSRAASRALTSRSALRPEPVDAHVLQLALLFRRRQLAAARDPDRLDPVRQQRPLGAEPERIREPDELPDGALLRRRHAELLADRRDGGALQPDPAAPLVVRPRDQHRPARAARAEVREHDHGLDPVAVLGRAREPARARVAEGLPVHRGQHERLARRASLDDARELEQGGGIRRAARGIGHRLGVARRHDHDLLAGRAWSPRDHVHERVAVLLPRVHARLEALRLERAEAGGQVARDGGARDAPRPPVRAVLDDVPQLAQRDPPVEQHVGGEPLRRRARPVLEREHQEHHREHGRNEGRTVDPGLDHPVGLFRQDTCGTYNFGCTGLLGPTAG
jgi:hypothetical protein